MNSKHRLSKTKYLAGIQCHERLWLEVYSPDTASPIEAGTRRRLDQGIQVGELAKQQFPKGVQIQAGHENISGALKETKDEIGKASVVILDAAFSFDDILVRTDIIRRNGSDSWDIIEVKSSTRVKDEHIPDVAIQACVLQGAGLRINKTFLMHVNNECVFPDLSNLFCMEEVTDQVLDLLPEIPQEIDEFRRTLELDEEPDIPIGRHCETPRTCPFYDHCWSWLPQNSIFTIPRLRWPVKEGLLEKNAVSVNDLPPDLRLNTNQKRYVKSVKERKALVDWDSIAEELGQLRHPLYFLDFETDNPAIPRFGGMHPYEHFPFQYSCHMMDRSGSLVYKEYLHESESDPRKPLLESLVSDIGDTGSIITYNVSFERRILNGLLTWFPEDADKLESMIERLWDLLPIFQRYYIDYQFQGSNTLKNVLPVLVPTMTYEDLTVTDGTQAQVAWNEMIHLPSGIQKGNLIKELKRYCRQDSLGMVEIYRRLESREQGPPSR